MSESFDARPPFFWGRDKADLVINDDAMEHTEEWLHEHTQLTARTYPGMGHAISTAEMVDVSAFLATTCCARTAGRRAPPSPRGPGATGRNDHHSFIHLRANFVSVYTQDWPCSRPTDFGGRKG